MPYLEFIGKNIVKDFHEKITPKKFEIINKYKTDNDDILSNNLIIKADNLTALKSLIPRYKGIIDCIYIDPPYNTGHKDWVYRDFSSSKDIDGLVFDKIGTRKQNKHDVWLCMMMPRLILLRDILSDTGLLFVSISDTEVHNLKLLLDEIFGENNFLCEIIIEVNKGGRDFNQVAKSHEYLLIYSKTGLGKIREIEKEVSGHRYEDDISTFDIRELRNRNPKFGRFNRPNLHYPFYVDTASKDEYGFCAVSLERKNISDIEVYPKNKRGKEGCWRWSKDLVSNNVSGYTNTDNVVAKQKSTGGWNIYEKYRKTTRKVKSIWTEPYMRTDQGTRDYNALGLDKDFQHPKPLEFIKKIMKIATNPDSIILDAFAGSGTTGQAVLRINSEDGGSRRFILIEDGEFIENITLKRVQKAVDNNNSSGFLYLNII